MTRRLLALFLSLSIFLVPFAAKAATESPTSLGPPEHFGVGYYYTDSVYLTMSAPEDVRAYMQKKTEEHPDNYPGFSLHFQLDYKIDGGAWHHTSEWDSPKTAPQVQQREFRCDFTYGKSYVSSGRWGLSGFFPDDEALKLYNEKGWEYLESHSITFRSRFVESFDKGNSYVISPWSKEFTLSANKKADYNKLINHAPTLLTGEVKKRGVEPYFEIKTDRIPGEIQDLNAISGNSIITEVWARMAGESEFKMLDTIEGFNEVIDLTASDFSAVNKDTFEGAGYEIKARYALDLRKYKQSGVESTTAVYIYSPFSNIISHNMPSWSKASAWATVELKKADDLELIPSILKGADMTKSITRKEFAAVSLKLYEKLSGKTVIPTVTNPFKDTNDQEVLKAYQVGITAGVAIDKFAPDDLLNREQAATMLTRVFKKSFVQGWTLEIDSKFDFNYTMPSKFTDDAKISNWAKPSVYFMVTHGIISGVGANNFAPRAITSAEQAANYASATREQALAISVRMTEKLDSTDAKEIIPLEQKPTEPTQPAEPTKPFEKQAGVSGVYMGFINTWAVTGYYTPRPYWLVLFDDGTFYYDLPSEGLDNFDKNNSNALTNENCGVYKINGSTGTWKRNNYDEEQKLEIDAKGNILLMGDTYYKLSSVDGMKLSGAWSYFADPKEALEFPGDEKPIIRFTKEGKFVDEGLLNENILDTIFILTEDDKGDGRSISKKEIAPGQGTYEIKNFTLILKYDDGRERRASFNLMGSTKPEQNPSLFYLSRIEVYLME